MYGAPDGGPVIDLPCGADEAVPAVVRVVDAERRLDALQLGEPQVERAADRGPGGGAGEVPSGESGEPARHGEGDLSRGARSHPGGEQEHPSRDPQDRPALGLSDEAHRHSRHESCGEAWTTSTTYTRIECGGRSTPNGS